MIKRQYFANSLCLLTANWVSDVFEYVYDPITMGTVRQTYRDVCS